MTENCKVNDCHKREMQGKIERLRAALDAVDAEMALGGNLKAIVDEALADEQDAQTKTYDGERCPLCGSQSNGHLGGCPRG